MTLVRRKSALAPPVRMKYLFLLATLVCSSSLLFYISRISKTPLFLITQTAGDIYRKYHQPDDTSFSTIRTQGCQIPFMQPIDDSVRPFVHHPKNLTSCKRFPLLGSNKTHIWIKKKNVPFYTVNYKNLSCCYKSFFRPVQIDDVTSSAIDDRVKYNNCKNFTDTIAVTDEFVRVTCDDSTQKLYDTFFLFALVKELIKSDHTRASVKVIPYNVLILGIDAVSRLNLHRTMPKTVKYLNSLGAVELLGYNKVGDNTFPNLMPMLLGRKDTELWETCYPNSQSTFDNCPFVWERFKQAGFATALAEDTSSIGTFNYLKRGFTATPTDYYLHTFMEEAELHAGTNKDFNMYLCMNEKFFYKILLDYVEDITMTLRTKLFGFFWEASMSHDKLNYPMVMDNSYARLISKMHDSDYLNKTIMFFVSDHGMRWGKFRSTKQGGLEERLPFLFAFMPPSFRYKYSEAYNNLKLNSRRLTTPFDMHATLSDLTNLDNIENEIIRTRSKEHYSRYRNISLFLPIPFNRTCKSADIDDHWCTCRKIMKISTDSVEAKEAAEHVVSHMNRLLKDYPQCITLTVEEVLEVTQMLTSNSVETAERTKFMVVLRTAQGGGMFEATLGRASAADSGDTGGGGGRWEIAGSISRLNLHRNQSHCVPLYNLKLYCYCK